MTNGDCFAVKCLGDYWGFTRGGIYDGYIVHHPDIDSELAFYTIDDDGDSRYICLPVIENPEYFKIVDIIDPE